MASVSRPEALVDNIQAVRRAVLSCFLASNTKRSTGNTIDRPIPRLVAVSKTKPSEDITPLYNAGQRHFGENYIKELCDKSISLPGDIRWHFIGNLQSNKIKQLITSVKGLWAIETIDSIKKVDIIQNTLTNEQKKNDEFRHFPLNVFIQINTSNEDNKNGINHLNVEEILNLSIHIIKNCSLLKFRGLMTIGSVDSSNIASDGAINPDFNNLVNLSKIIQDNIINKSSVDNDLLSSLKSRYLINTNNIDYSNINEDSFINNFDSINDDLISNSYYGYNLDNNTLNLELSMGMSSDFKSAINSGSTNVRVGSTIFGARDYSNIKSN